MNKLFFLMYIVGSFFCNQKICSWATPEQNINNTKLKVNFSGSIKVHQGNRWDNVENITIDGKFTQIQMRVLPETLPSQTVNEQTGKREIVLKEDPTGRSGYTILKLDLAEIKSIESIPNLTYVYKTQTGSVVHSATYIELIVTPKDSTLSKYHCLVLDTVKVKWDEKSSSGPVNMETPIGAVALLEISAMLTSEPPLQRKNGDV